MDLRVRQSAGFSLVELTLVVMITGVIGAIAVPRLDGFTEKADAAAIAETLRRHEGAFLMYRTQHGRWPKDVNQGVLPKEMADYLSERDFEGQPLGGTYDWQEWQTKSYGPGGVHVSVYNVKDWDMAKKVDALLDDGNLKTGAVVRYSNFLLLTLEK